MKVVRTRHWACICGHGMESSQEVAKVLNELADVSWGSVSGALSLYPFVDRPSPRVAVPRLAERHRFRDGKRQM